MGMGTGMGLLTHQKPIPVPIPVTVLPEVLVDEEELEAGWDSLDEM